MTTLKRPLSAPNSLQVVRDLARPWGTDWVEVESVSLVVGLSGTGSDPPPSADRDMLQREMQVRKVRDMNQLLASDDTSIVIVRALLPPGALKGDRVDVDVRVPARSKTTSLDGGWVMMTRLSEFAMIKQRLSQGHVMAHCQGHILVDSTVDGNNDPVMQTRGRILGGGVVSESREMGLLVRDEHLSIKTSAQIGRAINNRFHLYSDGDKKGVATPRRDSFISLEVHPRYRDNLNRYISVIESISVRESDSAMADRLRTLEARLLIPPTSSDAAIQLEAIGADSAPVLRAGLKASNPEVRFYAAEALAYLDDPSAATELGLAVKHEPAFRWRGLQALGAMDQIEAQEQLASLFHQESAETRYGAFRTLQRLAPNDPMVKGETLDGKMKLHQINSTGAPLVHFAKSERPEMVLFGEEFNLQSPVTLFAGKRIVVKNTTDGRLRVRRVTGNDADETRLVAAQLDDMVRAIVEMGGGYTDVIQAVTEARKNRCLECRVVFSAIPKMGRKYYRQWNGDQSPKDTSEAANQEQIPEAQVGTSLPDPNDRPTGSSKAAGTPAQKAASSTIAPPVAAPVSLVDDQELESMTLFDSDPDVLTTPAAVIDQIGPG